MPDFNLESNHAPGSHCFKEAVCIDADRIYDSCSDKDCLEDLRVFFTDQTQPTIDAAYTVKARSAEVLNVFMDVEPVPFNKGFFSVDMTYFFLVRLDAFTSPLCTPVQVEGLATFSKKVILFGSEGCVKLFTNDQNTDEEVIGPKALPKAIVQVAEPMILSTIVREACHRHESIVVPCAIANRFGGTFESVAEQKFVEVSLGVFTIIQLERKVQMMIPIYDFCVPDKECTNNTDRPCELFQKISFPIDQFFPPRLQDMEREESEKAGSCGC